MPSPRDSQWRGAENTTNTSPSSGSRAPRPFDPSTYRTLFAWVQHEVNRSDLPHFRALSSGPGWEVVVARAQLPTVSRLAREARLVVVQLNEACDAKSVAATLTAPRAASASFDAEIDAFVGRTGADAAAIEEVAVLAARVHGELRGRTLRLRALDPVQRAPEVIAECDAALRCIRRGLAALDLLLADACGQPRELACPSVLDELLLVRRITLRLSRALEARTPELENPRAELNLAARRLETVVDGEHAPLLAIADRLHLLGLLDACRVWLRSDDAPPVEALRLWGELVTATRALARVSERRELLEHDATVLARLNGGAATRPAEDHDERALLASLEGLDDELDALVLRGAPRTTYAPCLDRLARSVAAALRATPPRA